MFMLPQQSSEALYLGLYTLAHLNLQQPQCRALVTGCHKLHTHQAQVFNLFFTMVIQHPQFSIQQYSSACTTCGSCDHCHYSFWYCNRLCGPCVPQLREGAITFKNKCHSTTKSRYAWHGILRLALDCDHMHDCISLSMQMPL